MRVMNTTINPPLAKPTVQMASASTNASLCIRLVSPNKAHILRIKRSKGKDSENNLSVTRNHCQRDLDEFRNLFRKLFSFKLLLFQEKCILSS